MDASTEGLVAAHGHPGITIQMDTEVEGLAEEPEWCVLFTMDASTDGIVLHMGHCYNLCFFTIDASTEGLVVAHGTLLLCYNYQTCCGGSIQKLLITCVIYVYVMPEEQIPGVTFC